MRDLIIVSTKASEYFAELLATKLSASITGVERKVFAGGEEYRRFENEFRMYWFGRDVIVAAGITNDYELLDVCRLGSAIAKSGAHRVIYIIPFEAYTTMERAVKPNEVVTAKITARQLSQLPHGDYRNCFLFLDLHTAGFIHYLEGECLRFELYAEEILTEAIGDLGLPNFMFGSADLGRPKWVKAFAKKFETRMALIDKSRDFQTTKVEQVIGDVRGMNVIIYDDMIRSAKTLVDAAHAYIDEGAVAVYAVASHAAFDNETAIQRLLSSRIKTTVITNSHPMSQHPLILNSRKFIVKDVSGMYVGAISMLRSEN